MNEKDRDRWMDRTEISRPLNKGRQCTIVDCLAALWALFDKSFGKFRGT